MTFRSCFHTLLRRAGQLAAILLLVCLLAAYPAAGVRAAAGPDGEPEHPPRSGSESGDSGGATTTSQPPPAGSQPVSSKRVNAPDGLPVGIPSEWVDYCYVIHVVERGETLGVIAQWYGVALSTLMEVNQDSEGKVHASEGSVLCIPRPNPYAILPDFDLKIRLDLHRVYVQGAGVPVPVNIMVKVRNSPTGAWKKLGVMKVGLDGTFARTFNLPKSLWDSKFYEICVKDTYWGLSACSRVDYRWLPLSPNRCLPFYPCYRDISKP